MKWRNKLSIGASAIGAVVVWGAGIQGPLPAVATQASAATHLRVAPRAAQAVPTPPVGKPEFDATFRGRRLNTKIWDTCYPWVASDKSGCRNWGNPEEREWYQRSQVRVSGGVVHLVAQRKRTVGTTKSGAREVYDCRSGMITSYPGFRFKYGFVQVVANIPHAKGLWPALWLGAANWKYPPEIDMLESWGVNSETGSFFHPVSGFSRRVTYSPALTRGWQTYSLSWTRSSLKFYVGGRLVMGVGKNVPRQRMYFLADLAEYQPVKRGYCTGQLDIRSVKIWKE